MSDKLIESTSGTKAYNRDDEHVKVSDLPGLKEPTFHPFRKLSLELRAKVWVEHHHNSDGIRDDWVGNVVRILRTGVESSNIDTAVTAKYEIVTPQSPLMPLVKICDAVGYTMKIPFKPTTSGHNNTPQTILAHPHRDIPYISSENLGKGFTLEKLYNELTATGELSQWKMLAIDRTVWDENRDENLTSLVKFGGDMDHFVIVHEDIGDQTQQPTVTGVFEDMAALVFDVVEDHLQEHGNYPTPLLCLGVLMSRERVDELEDAIVQRKVDMQELYAFDPQGLSDDQRYDAYQEMRYLPDLASMKLSDLMEVAGLQPVIDLNGWIFRP